MSRLKILQLSLSAVGFAIILPVSATANPVKSFRISYTDLDFENKKDMRMLGRRIALAIEKVCGSYAEVHEVSDSEKIDECRSAARRQVAPQMARASKRGEMRLSSATPPPRQLCRSSVGHFSRSCWTKELSIGKRQNRKSGQFGSGVGP